MGSSARQRTGFARGALLALVALASASACAAPPPLPDPDASPTELRRLRDTAARRGGFEVALLAARALVEHAEAPGTADERAQLAADWIALGDAHVVAYDREAARASYQRALEAVPESEAPSEPVRARAHARIARLDRTRPDAILHASRALAIHEQRYARRHPEIVDARVALAGALWADGVVGEARRELETALGEARALAGEVSAEAALVQLELARIEERLERGNEAMRLYQAAAGALPDVEDEDELPSAEEIQLRFDIHGAIAALYAANARGEEAARHRALAVQGSNWTKLPVAVKRQPPVYPPPAKKRKQEGWVEVEFTISESGSPTDAHVVEATPDGVFERASLWAIRHWEYTPAERDGVPAPQRGVRVHFDFDLAAASDEADDAGDSDERVGPVAPFDPFE